MPNKIDYKLLAQLLNQSIQALLQENIDAKNVSSWNKLFREREIYDNLSSSLGVIIIECGELDGPNVEIETTAFSDVFYPNYELWEKSHYFHPKEIKLAKQLAETVQSEANLDHEFNKIFEMLNGKKKYNTVPLAEQLIEVRTTLKSLLLKLNSTAETLRLIDYHTVGISTAKLLYVLENQIKLLNHALTSVEELGKKACDYLDLTTKLELIQIVATLASVTLSLVTIVTSGYSLPILGAIFSAWLILMLVVNSKFPKLDTSEFEKTFDENINGKNKDGNPINFIDSLYEQLGEPVRLSVFKPNPEEIKVKFEEVIEKARIRPQL